MLARLICWFGQHRPVIETGGGSRNPATWYKPRIYCSRCKQPLKPEDL